MSKVDTSEISKFLKALHPDNKLTDDTLVDIASCNFRLVGCVYDGITKKFIVKSKNEVFRYEHLETYIHLDGDYFSIMYSVFSLNDILYRVKYYVYDDDEDDRIDTINAILPLTKVKKITREVIDYITIE